MIEFLGSQDGHMIKAEKLPNAIDFTDWPEGGPLLTHHCAARQIGVSRLGFCEEVWYGLDVFPWPAPVL
jgi:hypothetical protein